MIRDIFLYRKHSSFYYLRATILGFIAVLCLKQNSICQDSTLSNLKTHIIPAKTDTILFELSSIIPHSLYISQNLSNSLIDFELLDNSLRINNLSSYPIDISYRVYNFNLFNKYSLLDSSKIKIDERIMLLPSTSDQNTNRRLIESSQIQYSGNFTRGVSFGNTQDVVLNSNLNLQISGDLGNGMSIRAALSDDNIPLQAEGNTLVLQEFNKVFIELEKNNTKIIAGDYELGRPQSYFMNYFKKLQGISVLTQNSSNNGWLINNKASFAISRGKFRRIILNIQEGNQGPYRLDGENGELFLQVLSGTEKVYADGRLLQRGENNDYVIDYNRAELRFTPQLVISANLRIIVEYEYAVQSYLRSLYATETTINNENWMFTINSYSEQDSKSTTGNIQLDSIDLKILQEGGDNNNFRSGIQEYFASSANDNIRYSLNNGILEYAPRDSQNVYAVQFSNFGTLGGDYIIDQDAGANGRVYKYVGESMGNFLPLIKLVPPEQKQMFSSSASFSPRDSTSFFVEAALSNYDKNRFSTLDNEDNSSHSIVFAINDARKIKHESSWIVESQAKYEFVKKNFQILNPYRTAEFARDWNLSNNTVSNNQNLFETSVRIKNESSQFGYHISNFNSIGEIKGTRHQPFLDYHDKTWLIKLKGDFLSSEVDSKKVEFIRPRATIQKSIFNEKINLGFYLEKERNLTNADVDSLSSESFNYDLYRFSMSTKFSEKSNITLAYATRIDDRVFNNELERSTVSRNIELMGSFQNNNHSSLNWQLVMRDFSVDQEFNSTDQNKKSLIGNLSHHLHLLKNGIDVVSYYESNSGQEPKIEFQYVQVQTGEGSYLWNDYNNDDIRQINEFEIAPFSDLASFEKIIVFNNEFISTNRFVLNQSIKIDPAKFLTNTKSFLARLYLFSRYKIDQKLQNDFGSGLFNIINFNLNDERLVSFNSSFDHTLFFNRGNPRYDINFSLKRINNKFLQISGFEQRNSTDYSTRLRYNLDRKLDFLIEASTGFTVRNSENFDAQNFDISFWGLNPKFNLRPNAKLRFIFDLKTEFKKNSKNPESEKANIFNFGFELTWRQNSVSNLELTLNYVDIEFAGVPNSNIEFEMLQGLKNGKNGLWEVNYIRRLSNNMDLILNYSGRKSPTAQTVNIASMQMRAVF